MTATLFSEDGTEITSDNYVWSFKLGDGTDATSLVETKTAAADNKIKVKFLGDESYVGKHLIATCSSQGITGEESFDVVFM